MWRSIDAAGNTFAGAGLIIFSSTPGRIVLRSFPTRRSSDLIGNAFFDANFVPALFGAGNANLELGSSFTGVSAAHTSERTVPQRPACVRGSSDFTGSTTGAAVGTSAPARPSTPIAPLVDIGG